MAFKFLELCWMDYLEHVQDFVRTGEDTYFEDHNIYGEDTNPRDGQNYLRNELVLKILLLLIYCTLKNN